MAGDVMATDGKTGDGHFGELVILGSGASWFQGVQVLRQLRADDVPVACWAINSLWRRLPGEVDMAFNMHLNRSVDEAVLRRWHPGVDADGLAKIRAGLMTAEEDPSGPLECGIPMVMCWPPPGAPPNVLAYPIDAVLERFPMGYFNNGISYMIALALLRRESLPEVIHFYGTDYHEHPDGSLRLEAEYERPCQEFWMGVASGMGVRLSFPKASNLFSFGEGGIRVMYGYEQCHKGKYDRAFEYVKAVVADGNSVDGEGAKA